MEPLALSLARDVPLVELADAFSATSRQRSPTRRRAPL